jgi:carboxyl-terminal processing protease
MRTIARLILIFLAAALAVGAAYGLGYYTAVRVSDSGALAAVRTALAGRAGTAQDRPGVLPPAGASTDPAQFAVFWEAWREVRDNYDGPLPDDKDVTYGAIRGSLRALEDPFTLFTDPVNTEIQRPELEGEFEGIGAFVTTSRDGLLMIQTPMRGQPAEKAGIRAGDVVIKVDGTDITKMDINDAVLLIRGPKGTTVTLTLLREGEAEPLVIPVVRDRIEIPSVNEVRVLEREGAPEVGYLQLTVFAQETKQELDQALEELRSLGARALILDLRNNPGGFLDTAIEVASEFIGDGTIVIQEDNEGHRHEERVMNGGHALDLPLVVLVNQGSASASEIVAGAIRDHARGVIVGETTFGKGSVQNVHSLSDGSQLRVTIAAWLTPNGSLIHQKGITPDVVVEPPPPPTPDATADATPPQPAATAAPAEGEAGQADEGPPDVQLLRAIDEARRLMGRP